MRNISRWLFVPYILWMLLFIIVPILLLVYFSFVDLDGHFSLTNYQQILSSRYLIMFWESILYASLITLITLAISLSLIHI